MGLTAGSLRAFAQTAYSESTFSGRTVAIPRVRLPQRTRESKCKGEHSATFFVRVLPQIDLVGGSSYENSTENCFHVFRCFDCSDTGKLWPHIDADGKSP